MSQIIGVPELLVVAVLSAGAYFAYRVVRLLNRIERNLDH
jgi:hypothetical protein